MNDEIFMKEAIRLSQLAVSHGILKQEAQRLDLRPHRQ